MKSVGIVFIFLAVIVFFCAFFLLAPYIAGLIPAGEWQGFGKVITYIIIAYIGGIGIPLALVVIGIGAICED